MRCIKHWRRDEEEATRFHGYVNESEDKLTTYTFKGKERQRSAKGKDIAQCDDSDCPN